MVVRTAFCSVAVSWKICLASALESALCDTVVPYSFMIFIGLSLLWREQESVITFLGHLVVIVARQCGFDDGSPIICASGNEIGGAEWGSRSS